MPRIDLISKDEAIKLGDEEGHYIIRRLPQEIVRQIRERHTKRIESEIAGAPPREETDWAAVELDQLDYIIQDWLVYGPGGERAPCTRGNKTALPQGERAAILQAAGAANLEGDISGPLRSLKGPSKADASQG